ncbi:hypothetical protein Tco_0394285 [Tanacetum coccineum]
MTYLCLHFTKDHKGTWINTPYPEESIRRIQVMNRNGNVVAARAEGNGNGNSGNQIWCYNCRGIGDLDEIEEVNANCILMANLQQASTSGP